jgi:hypothetical protein
MANDDNVPHQGGTRDDISRPDGLGKPSENDPVLPSRQTIATPSLPPRKRK